MAESQELQDAGNVIESHANVLNSNVYLGAAGEAAHWDAMNFSIDAILKGEPVDVWVSKGTSTVTLQDFKGLSPQAVQDWLTKNGLSGLEKSGKSAAVSAG